MTAFHDSMTLRAARDCFFAQNEAVFGRNGGYDKKWVKIELGPIPFWIPNCKGRVRAAKLHDLHHLATGYSTHIVGECEIGGWEVGAGCGTYMHAWMLNMWAIALGLFIAPRKTFRAFVRGRHTDTLYHAPFNDTVLDQTLGEIRSRLRLYDPQPRAGAADVIQFMFWSAISLVVALIPVVPALTALAGIVLVVL